jgi:hypothetical protein
MFASQPGGEICDVLVDDQQAKPIQQRNSERNVSAVESRQHPRREWWR